MRAKYDITVKPQLTPKMRESISAALGEHILRVGAHMPTGAAEVLKKKIEAHVFSGGRAESLVREFLAFGLSKGVASKLAFQASSIVLSKYRELQARSIGSMSYKWRSSHDERVCERCRRLNGQIFFWDRPPDGGHPGECLLCPDKAGCRCVAMPEINVD